MSSPETPEPQQSKPTRQVTVTVPEQRAEQFEALARRVLAVWEYRDAYGEPRLGGRRRRRGRHFGHRAPGAPHRHGRCAAREEDSAATVTGGSVETT